MMNAGSNDRTSNKRARSVVPSGGHHGGVKIEPRYDILIYYTFVNLAYWNNLFALI